MSLLNENHTACPKCNASISSDSKKCTSCGATGRGLGGQSLEQMGQWYSMARRDMIRVGSAY
ncbi:hypothetical protein E4U31_008296 [Claviceps sp. LM219 group G6]|nr:hypothetical protein E4U31_008296 [Claviceps sp. LM219 group G6]